MNLGLRKWRNDGGTSSGDGHEHRACSLTFGYGFGPNAVMGLATLLLMVVVTVAWGQGASRSERASRRESRRDASAASNRSSSTNSSSTTNAVAKSELGAFGLISDRNIFNPNRGPRSSGRTASTNEAPVKPIVVETFSLVGTLLHGQGQFAFFDGSGSLFKKALRVEESIGGTKLKEIGQNQVKLDVGGKEMLLAIGMQMRRQDEGPWELKGRPLVESNTGKSTDPASSSEEDEIIRKLMQKREKE